MLEKYLRSLEISGKSDRTIATRKGQLISFFAWLLKETNSNDPLEIAINHWLMEETFVKGILRVVAVIGKKNDTECQRRGSIRFGMR